MNQVKEAFVSQMELRLNRHLLKFEKIKSQIKKKGLSHSSIWLGAMYLVSQRTRDIRANLKYLKKHQTAKLQKMISYSLLADLNSLVREISRQYKKN